MYGTVGLQIDRNDDTGCSMYACVGNSFSGNTTSGGLAHYDLCNGEQLNFISFETVKQGDIQFINDVVILDSEIAYVTDSYGQVFI